MTNMNMDGMEYKDSSWIIDNDSQAGLLLAIENFIYKCSKHILPENVDREQLIANIERMRNLEHRKKWLMKDFCNKEYTVDLTEPINKIMNENYDLLK